MNKYRKKPVIIEAIQLSRKFFELAYEFIPKEVIDCHCSGEFYEDACYIDIKTLEGIMKADEGDYIIKGTHGEFYPVKRHIFEANYEKVEE
jgi:hypothetical protein